MKSTPDLCDQYPDLVQVVEPMFSNFGGREYFSGEIVTVKCFEDNSCVKQLVDTQGQGRVMVVDGGGSMRRACLGGKVQPAYRGQTRKPRHISHHQRHRAAAQRFFH